jgi:hypothetical protein
LKRKAKQSTDASIQGIDQGRFSGPIEGKQREPIGACVDLNDQAVNRSSQECTRDSTTVLELPTESIEVSNRRVGSRGPTVRPAPLVGVCD